MTVRWDRTDAGILEVDRFSLERPLVGDLLITHHRDQPGIVGRIGMILGADGVNIAGMQVARHERGGAAIMVVNVDDAISDRGSGGDPAHRRYRNGLRRLAAPQR